MKRIPILVLVLVGLAGSSAIIGQTTTVGIPPRGFAPPVWVEPASAVNGSGTIAIGTGGATAAVGGTLLLSTTSASNSGVAETDLISYAMPGGTLAVNSRGVRIRAWGSTAANVNSKVGRLYFGATLLTSTTTTTSAVNWSVDGTVVRTGAATQIGVGFSNAFNSGYNTFLTTAPVETLSGAVTIKVTGQSAVGSSDITALGLFVEAI